MPRAPSELLRSGDKSCLAVARLAARETHSRCSVAGDGARAMAGSPLRRPRFRPWSNRSGHSVGSQLGRAGCCGTICCPGLALAFGHPHPWRRGCRRPASRASPRPQLIDRPGNDVRGGRRFGPDRHARANDGSGTAAPRSVVCDRLLRNRQPDPHRPPDASFYRRKDRQPHAVLTLTIAGLGSMAAVALVLVSASYGWGVRKGALAATFSLVQVRSRGEWQRPPSCSD